MPSVFTGSLGPERRCTRHRGQGHKVVNSHDVNLGFYWCAVLGSNHILVGLRWSPWGNLWCEVFRKPLVYSYAGNQDCLPRIKLFKKLSSPAYLPAAKKKKKKTVCVKQSLTLEIHSILDFCWGHQLLSCLRDSVQSQTPGRKERTTLTPPRTGVPLGTGGVSSWMQTRRGDREAISVLSFQVNKPRNLCWVLTSPSHTFFFTVHLTNITVHQSLI